MRRQGLVASAVLTAALALGALPGVSGSQTLGSVRPLEAEAFQTVRLPASADGLLPAIRPLDAGYNSAGHLAATDSLIEPGTYAAPAERRAVAQPVPTAVRVVPPKPKVSTKVALPQITLPRHYRLVLTGLASWYDNGTTAMRLRPGTHVKICGAAGCVVRVINDWGPARYLTKRVVDLMPGDFVRVTGKLLGAGLASVTVYIY